MRALSCLTLAVLAAGARAGDWPQWLGPNRDGTSPEVVKPWTEAPKVLWRVAVGEGHSSPVVAGSRVYLLYKAPGKDEEWVSSFDAGTGEKEGRFEQARGAFNSPFGA